ncbi:MAG: DUF4402 domain-containing protein [Gemmatimonadaceae bacterium]|nr:DUF4402 domain-containing protein [Gemmatimonadaceae bacterium]
MAPFSHSLRTLLRAVAVMLLLPAVWSVRVHAQVSGTVNVTARVNGSLSVTTQDDLAFGTFTAPFAARRVSFTDNGPLGRRGRFTIRGEGDTELMMELTVPDAMRGGSGVLPLADWGMRMNTVDADNGGSDVALFPGVNRASMRMPGAAGVASMLYFRVRATALPNGTQAPGAYAATVQISLNYVGA